MNAPLYTTEILRLAASLPDPSALGREDGRVELRSPTCGSVIAVAVQIENHRIQALSLRVQACAFGQAASAIMARHAQGSDRNTVEQALGDLSSWLNGGRRDPGSWPGLDALTAAQSRKSRHGAIVLPFRALLAAIEDAVNG